MVAEDGARGWKVLVSVDDGREERVVVCRTEGALGLVVEERTAGETTRAIYDAARHVHRVRVARDDLADLVHGIGGRDATSADEALGGFFGEGPYLSDLMDEMDVQGIPYAYVSEGERSVAYRPPRGR